MKPTYDDCQEKSDSIGEREDCAVTAVSIVGRVDYFKAHDTLRKFGRVNRQGTLTHETTIPGLLSLGCEVKRVKKDRQQNGCRYTPKSIHERCAKGYYLCETSTHIFAVVNGRVCDWTENKKHRITNIYKVTKTKRRNKS